MSIEQNDPLNLVTQTAEFFIKGLIPLLIVALCISLTMKNTQLNPSVRGVITKAILAILFVGWGYYCFAIRMQQGI